MDLSLRLAAVAISPFFGSFVCCFIDRVPRGVAFAWSRSRCESCDAVLGARDLIPILSYLALHGKCRKCKVEIPFRLIQAEIAIALLTAVAVCVSEPRQMLGVLALAWLLFALAQFDIVHGRLPDVLTAALGCLGLGWSLLYRFPLPFIASITGAAIGILIPLAAAKSYRLITQREGLGGGDIKLFGASGVWIGWDALPTLLLTASLSAIFFMLATGRQSRLEAISFGPFIAFATFAIWCWKLTH